MIGKRFGQYEIVEHIGAGGMGEVYRARDAKLDRDVAIKMLPAELAQDPGRLDRFEREAFQLLRRSWADFHMLSTTPTYLEYENGRKSQLKSRLFSKQSFSSLSAASRR